jgi:hypothetical protein
MRRYPDHKSGTGPTRHSRGTLISSASSTGMKCTADAFHDGDTSETNNAWGKGRSENRGNKAVAGRQHVKLQKSSNDK